MNTSSAPRRVLATNGPWPLHGVAATAAAEAAAQARSAPMVLMEAAGLAVARLALALAPHTRHVQVWAGPGNNGGDGLVAARLLHQAGWTVRVHLLAVPEALPADAHEAWRRANAAGVVIAPWAPDSSAEPGTTDTLHIDALLGLGVRRAPRGAIAAAIAAINHAGARGAPVLAIDLPSGLHPDTGQFAGAPASDEAAEPCAVQASATLSLLSLKPGLFTGRGRDHSGAVWWHGLGVALGPPDALLSGPPATAPRPHNSHKGRHGDVAVVGGAPGMVGAAWLAARAALAAGAGRVYVSPLDAEAALLDPSHPALMSRRAWWTGPPEALAAATVVAGCGGGETIAAALPRLLAEVPQLVLDADALNAIARTPTLQTLLKDRANQGRPTVLTPHPLEAARLLGRSTVEVQAQRIEATRELAARFSATVVLKGSGTVLASPGALPRINPTGNAALASAGTGDVLAGWLAGLWAQTPEATALDVAAQAVWQHGRAADAFGPAAHGAPLRAEALVEALALRRFDTTSEA